MPHTIYKYPFMIDDRFVKLLPKGSRILRVAPQNGIPTMWVLHSTDTSVVNARVFRMYGTGREILDIENLIHVSTFELNNFVWHLFEELDGGSKFLADVVRESYSITQE